MAALPRVTVEKLLREVLPADLVLQKETIDWVTESAADFLRLVGENANKVAESSAKAETYRVTADHVVQALQNMDMEKYLKDVQDNGQAGQDASTLKRRRTASRKAALATASHEELLAEQNALFQQATSQAARQGW